MKPIALQMYTLRDRAQKDFAAVLKTVADIGYVGVELAGLYGKSAKEVRKLLDDAGLVCCSAHVSIPNKDSLNQMVDEARTLGYDSLIAGKWIDDFKTTDAIKRSAEEFQNATALLKPHGLKMGYHNHWVELDKTDGRYNLEILLELAPAIFSELDIYWASNFGQVDVPAFIKKNRKRIELLHVKNGTGVRQAPHVAVGEGKVDIPPCIQAADEKLVRWHIVELDECATDMVEAVRKSYQYLTGKGLSKGKK